MRQTRLIRWLVPCVLVILGLVLGGTPGWGAAGPARKVNQDARLLKEFSDRVQAYVKLHRRLQAKAPPLKGKSDPETIAAHQKALANAICAARADAKPGDIFFPEVRPYFLRVIKNELKRSGAPPARAAVMEEDQKKVYLHVNVAYPESAPLSTVPPSVLLKLPRLPAEVEYRFINRHLILRDTKANLIIDFILEAIP